MNRLQRAAFALIVALSLWLMTASCSMPLSLDGDTYRIGGKYLMDPLPPLYPELMEGARACLKPDVVAMRTFDGVTFYWTTFIERKGSPEPEVVLGLYREQEKEIIIDQAEVFMERVPFHEMMHYLWPSAEHWTPAFARCDPFQNGGRIFAAN